MFSPPARALLARCSSGGLGQRAYSSYHAMNAEILNCRNAFQIEQLIFRSQDFNHVNVATAFRTLAKTGSTNTMAVEVLLDFAKRNTEYEPRNLSQICYAIAKGNLCKQIPEQFVKILETAKVENFRPQAYANTLWGFGRLVHKAPRVFQRFGNQVQSLQDFSSAELASTVWAYARVDYAHKELFSRVAREVCEATMIGERDLGKFSAHQLSNIAWAFAKLGARHELLCETIANEVIDSCHHHHHHDASKRKDGFDPQAVANLIWAFETLEFDYPPELDVLAATGS